MNTNQTKENCSEQQSFSKESEKNVCTTCDSEFSSERILRNHICQVHELEIVECHLCKKHVTGLKKHIKIVHSEDTKLYRCDPCNKELTSKYALKKHFQVVHHRILDHKCETCEKTFSTKPSLIDHTKKYHEIVKDFKCKQCDREYFTANGLKAHVIDFHEKKVLYPCGTCGQKFSRKWYTFFMSPLNFFISILGSFILRE